MYSIHGSFPISSQWDKKRPPAKSCFWLADSLKNLLLWNLFAKRQVSDTGSATRASCWYLRIPLAQKSVVSLGNIWRPSYTFVLQYFIYINLILKYTGQILKINNIFVHTLFTYLTDNCIWRSLYLIFGAFYSLPQSVNMCPLQKASRQPLEVCDIHVFVGCLINHTTSPFSFLR